MWYGGRGKWSGLLRYVGLITVLILGSCVMVFIGYDFFQGGGVKTFNFTMSDVTNDTSLEFFIKLWDKNAKLLGADGTLSVKLWGPFDGHGWVDTSLPTLQEWDNIPVDKDDLVEGVGVPINLA